MKSKKNGSLVSKNIAICALACASVLISHRTFAANTTSVQHISFEDLKSACLNPSSFHNQTAPANIQISCKDVQYKWISADAGTYSLPTSRDMTAMVSSDKYDVDSSTSPVVITPDSAACPRFKQIAETVDTVRAITCDQIVAFSGTGAQFCADSVNTMRSTNPDSIQKAETGQTFDLCNSASQMLATQSHGQAATK